MSMEWVSVLKWGIIFVTWVVAVVLICRLLRSGR